jgi:hypothetical protein
MVRNDGIVTLRTRRAELAEQKRVLTRQIRNESKKKARLLKAARGLSVQERLLLASSAMLEQ